MTEEEYILVTNRVKLDRVYVELFGIITGDGDDEYGISGDELRQAMRIVIKAQGKLSELIKVK